MQIAIRRGRWSENRLRAAPDIDLRFWELLKTLNFFA
jgi:hypothetical protein